MASCISCGAYAGCSCSLTNGLCSSCISANKEKRTKSITVASRDTTCNYTLESLRRAMISLINKPNKGTLDQYHLSIIRSQINQFEEEPCRFQNIINNLNLDEI